MTEADKPRSRPPSKRNLANKPKWYTDLPKRPRTSYQIFTSEFKATHPDVSSMKTLSTLSSKHWREISAEDKHKYEVLAARAKINYLWKLAEFKEAHPELYKELEEKSEVESDTKKRPRDDSVDKKKKKKAKQEKEKKKESSSSESDD
eukprot:TRINITY_DN28048_c0_g1_i1.p1 TRINITY_DN28048_c0_g1~~TRINITY_DN28048_c0_g1_i1.p1  ORF type:complete len:148 (-),score=33.77 TRINITY_DN28048_c0_g1_i1:51-494(-)